MKLDPRISSTVPEVTRRSRRSVTPVSWAATVRAAGSSAADRYSTTDRADAGTSPGVPTWKPRWARAADVSAARPRMVVPFMTVTLTCAGARVGPAVTALAFFGRATSWAMAENSWPSAGWTSSTWAGAGG